MKQNSDWWLFVLFDNTNTIENNELVVNLKEAKLSKEFDDIYKYLDKEANSIKHKKVKQTSIQKILLHLEP